MAMVKPPKENFNCYLPLQEESGSRVDLINGYTFLDFNTVTYGAGHVQANAAYFNFNNDEDLYCADAAWQGGGANDFSYGGWVKWKSDGGNSRGCAWGKGIRYQVSNVAVYASLDERFFAQLGAVSGWNTNNTSRIFSGSSVVQVDTWYYIIHMIDNWTAHHLYVFDTAGASVYSASKSVHYGNNDSALPLVLGCCGDGQDGAYAGDDVAGYFHGYQEQFFIYAGLLSADEREYMVNGGAGRTWASWAASTSVAMGLGKNFIKRASGILEPKREVLKPNREILVPA